MANDGNAQFDRRIRSSYSIPKKSISPETIAEVFKDCLLAIRTISSIDVCSIQLSVHPSDVEDSIDITVQVNEGTGSTYSLNKVDSPPAV